MLFHIILNLIISIPSDKLLHFIGGALVCLFSFAIAYRFLPLWACFAIADGAAISALLLKELYDHLHPEGHSVEWKDVLAGTVGMAVINIALLIMLL